MKKIFMASGMLLGLLVFNNNVNAACGAGVALGEESLCMARPCSSIECEYTPQNNANGTAYTKMLEDGNIILVLNNYNGGSISFWSGLGNPFIGEEIELIGDNYITNENSYGILSSVVGINFVGEGTLTIKSRMPFVSTDFDRYGLKELNHSVDSKKITTVKITAVESQINIVESMPLDDSENNQTNTEIDKENTENKEEIKEETNKENIEVKDDAELKEEISNKTNKLKKNNILLFVSLGFSVICLISVLVLIRKNIKLKRLLVK